MAFSCTAASPGYREWSSGAGHGRNRSIAPLARQNGSPMISGGVTAISSLSKELSSLGPLFQIVETVVTQANNQPTVQLCTANALRWALSICPPSGQQQDVVIALQASTIIAGGGRVVALHSTGSPVWLQNVELNTRQHGTLAQQAFYGGFLTGSFPISNVLWTVWEVLLVPG